MLPFRCIEPCPAEHRIRFSQELQFLLRSKLRLQQQAGRKLLPEPGNEVHVNSGHAALSFNTGKRSSLAHCSACFAPSMSGIPAVSVHPFTAIIPLMASTEIITLCLPIALCSSDKKPVSSFPSFHAEEPIITFSAPSDISSLAFFTSRIPPPTRTEPFLRRLFNMGVLRVSPFCFPSLIILPKAASRSMTAVSP